MGFPMGFPTFSYGFSYVFPIFLWLFLCFPHFPMGFSYVFPIFLWLFPMGFPIFSYGFHPKFPSQKSSKNPAAALDLPGVLPGLSPTQQHRAVAPALCHLQRSHRVRHVVEVLGPWSSPMGRFGLSQNGIRTNYEKRSKHGKIRSWNEVKGDFSNNNLGL